MLVLGLYFVAYIYIVNFLCLPNITGRSKINIFEYWSLVFNEGSQNHKPFNGWHLPLWGVGGRGALSSPELPHPLSFYHLWPENLKAAVESQLSLFSVTNNVALMCSQNIQTLFVLYEGRCSSHAVNFIGIDLAHVSCRHSSLWSCLGFLPLLEPQSLASSRFP